MTEPRWAKSSEAKAHGWFSRRHETAEAHREAQENYKDNHSVEARKRRAYARGGTLPKEDEDD